MMMSLITWCRSLIAAVTSLLILVVLLLLALFLLVMFMTVIVQVFGLGVDDPGTYVPGQEVVSASALSTARAVGRGGLAA